MSDEKNLPTTTAEDMMAERAEAREEKPKTEGAIAKSRRVAGEMGQRREPVIGCAVRNERKRPSAHDHGVNPSTGPHRDDADH